jgi:hypothetical protein
VEHLRLIAGELQMAGVRSQVALSLFTDFENFSVFKPADSHRDAVTSTLDQVVAWSNALAPPRQLTQGIAERRRPMPRTGVRVRYRNPGLGRPFDRHGDMGNEKSVDVGTCRLPRG